MTPEQAAKLRKGDKLTVCATVTAVAAAGPSVCVSVFGTGSWWITPDEIISILPRPLEAGDRVKDDDQDQIVGTIIAVHAQEAWVVWDGFRSTGVYPLSDLQRVEDEE